MARRKSITRGLRLRVWTAANGKCHLCSRSIAPGEPWEIEHIKPISMGGRDDETNMAPAHVDCHKGKSKAEAPVRAKADAVGKKHAGIKKDAKGPKLQSRGFTPVEKEKVGVDKKGLPPLPRRSLYEDIE